MACLQDTANTIKESFSQRRSPFRWFASNTSPNENNNTVRSDTCSHLHSDSTRELKRMYRISLSSAYLASESSNNSARPRSNSFSAADSGNNAMFSQPYSPATSEEQKWAEFRKTASSIPLKTGFATSEVLKHDMLTILADPSDKLDLSSKYTYPPSSDPLINRDYERPSPPPDEFIPPDGGFGWVVATAACLANIWIIGFIKCYSILYLEIKERFPDSTAYEASWIPVMLSTIGLLVSPLIGAMCCRYRVRTIASVGGFLCFLGIFLSAFATTLTQMVLTMGVLTGLGSGMVQTPSVLIVNMYFTKRRALASAICVSGNALGGFLIPPLMEYLLREYRLQGALLIVAALQLHILLSTFLYRPTRDHALIQARQRREEEDRKGKFLQSIRTNSSKRCQRKNYISNFDTLYFALRTTSKSSLKKVQTSLVLTKQDSEEDATPQGISSNKSMSLTESAPNPRRFSETFAQSACKNIANCKTDLVRLRSRYIGNVQCKEFTIPSTGAQIVSKKYVRKRSASESTADEQISSGNTLKDFKLHLPKAEPKLSRNEPMTLRRFAVVNTATRKRKLVENSDSLFSSSDCDGIRFSSAISLQRGNSMQGNRCDVTQQLISENDLEPKIYKMGSSQRDLVVYHKENKSDGKAKLPVSPQRSSKSNICFAITKSCFDNEVLKTVSMILTCISSSLFILGAPHAFFYLHAYYTSVNIDSRVVTKLLSLSSIVDLSGRLIVGYVADMNVVRLSLLYFVCTGLAGTSVFCVPLVRSAAGIAVVLSGLGFGLGGFVVLLPTTLTRNHGINKLSSSYSFVKMLHGSMNFISPQVCGLLTDLTGSYASVYYFMGTAMMLSSVLQKSRNPNKKAAKKEAEQANA